MRWFFGNLFMVLTVLFAGLTIGWVISAAVIWPAQDAEYQHLCLYQEAERCVLEAWGPKIVRLEDEVTYRLTFHHSSLLGAPVSVALTIPQEMILLAPPEDSLTQQVVLIFRGLQPEETQTIRLANARIVSGFAVQWQSVTVSVQTPLLQKSGEKLYIGVESIWRGMLRQSGSGKQEVPIAPLVSLLLSVGTGVYQYLQVKRNEQHQKVQEQKELAQKELEKIRAAIRKKDFQRTRMLLENLEHTHLSSYLAEEIAQVRHLIALSSGKLDGWQPDSIPENWQDETTAAILYAANHAQIDRVTLEIFARKWATEKIKDEILRSEWGELVKNIGADTSLHVRESPRPRAVTFPGLYPLLPSNPFPVLSTRAEDEELYLYNKSQSLFWVGHPVFNQLKQNIPAWIRGESGSGKTALALSIGKYCFLGEKNFARYFKGLPSWMDIQSEMSRRLLETILEMPFYLPSGEERLALIVEVLLYGSENRLIVAQIEEAQEQRWHWLEKAKDEKQREIWQAQTRMRLLQLANAVRKVKAPIADSMWPAAWQAVMRFLQFDPPTYLVFDIAGETSLLPQRIATLEKLEAWTADRIYSLFFTLPNTPLKPYLESWCFQFSLRWSEKNLRDMMDYRLKIAKVRQDFEQLFEREAGSAFLEYAQGNPARLGRLWNSLVSQPEVKTPFTIEQVATAAKTL